MCNGTHILRTLAAATLFYGSFAPGETAESNDIAIIVHQQNPASNVSIEELRRIFRSEKNHWPDGRKITVVMLSPGHPERVVVLQQVYKFSEQDFARFFLQAIFTGQAQSAPKELATEIGMRKFVFNVPGAIGYVRVSALDSSVKALRIDGHTPGEAGYPLHSAP